MADPLYRFDDLSDLLGYWSATPTESVIDETGGSVQSVEPAYPAGAPSLIRSGTDGEITTGVTIGTSLAAFNIGTPTDSALTLTFATPLVVPDTGITFVCVTQQNSVAHISRMFTAHNDTDGTEEHHIQTTSNVHRARVNSDAIDTVFAAETTPTISIYSLGETANSLRLHIKNDSSDGLTEGAHVAPGASAIDRTTIMGNGTTYVLNGKLALFAIYTRALNLTEIDQVKTLCQTWIDTGAAPIPPVLDTSTEFTVEINDPTATLEWQCNRTDVGDWYIHDDPANGLSASREERNGAVSTLHIDTGVVADSGQIRCKASDPGRDDLYSAVENLVVQEATP